MNQPCVSKPQPLTKYPPASFRELLYLTIPLVLSLFSASFMGFCDRLFLARYSLEALEASVTAGYLSTLFQHPVIRVVSMAQVFVGLYRGSGQNSRIGESVWQMIWVSFFSMLITLPSSYFVAPFFFSGSAIQEPAYTYFNTLMVVNFLFPLGAALSSYFIGQGRARIIFLTTLVSHGLNIGLTPLFIFGLDGVCPSMGIFGAALATAIAQGIFCLALFLSFLRKKDRELYQTGRFHFKWDTFWSQLRIGLPRAVAKIILLTAWVCTARIMTLKGGDFLMVLSVGGSLILLFTFISEGMSHGMITITSTLLGAKEYDKIWQAFRSGLVFLFITTILLSIPYLFMPQFTLSFFFSSAPSPETYQILKRSCIWLWIFFFCYGFNAIAMSLILAARDVTFYMFSIIFIWITSYLPAYLAMNVWHWPPDTLWLIMAFDSFIYGIIFLIRFSKEKWKEVPSEENLESALSS